MGINDRAYMQGSGPGGSIGAGGHSRGGPMSFTTILIIINVAVFIVDGMLAKNLSVPVQFGPAVVETAAIEAQVEPVVAKPEWNKEPADTIVKLDVIASGTNRDIGDVSFVYMRPIEAFGHFSTATGFFRFEIWRFVTFQFLHADFMHLFFNMLGLYFFGPIVERWLGSRKKFAAFYLSCGVMGGAAYLLLNLLGNVFGEIPGFLPTNIYVPLVGASAGVFGVLMASAKLAGEARMLVMFVIPLKVSTGAYLMTGLAALNLLLGGSNAGGDAAHLGGAIAGFVLIRRSHWLNDFFDILGHKKRQNSRVERKPTRKVAASPSPKEQAEVDRLLDKVKAQGIASLTDRERAFLERVSRDT